MSRLAGLGRLPSKDTRRANFPMSAPQTQRIYRNHLLHGPVGDQLNTPHCVAFAWEHLLRFLPVVNARRTAEQIDKVKLYNEAQKIDYWIGENYDGTSVDAGAKILRSWGYLSGWTWADNAATVASHVLGKGPVVAGTTWTYGMFTPDRNGFIHPDGGNAGGHAYVIKGFHATKQAPWSTGPGVFYLTNSWGRGWAGNGHARIAFDDLDALIKDRGEACAPVEIQR